MPAIPMFVLKENFELFKKCQQLKKDFPRLTGTILCTYSKENITKPELYWNGLYLESFNGNSAENPKTYKTIRGLESGIKAIKKYCSYDRVYVCFWYHEECYFKPNLKYTKITGGQYPGCPRS